MDGEEMDGIYIIHNQSVRYTITRAAGTRQNYVLTSQSVSQLVSFPPRVAGRQAGTYIYI